MKPITIKSHKAIEYKEVEETWTEEEIRDLWGDDTNSIVIQLLNRVKEVEEESDKLLKFAEALCGEDIEELDYWQKEYIHAMSKLSSVISVDESRVKAENKVKSLEKEVEMLKMKLNKKVCKSENTHICGDPSSSCDCTCMESCIEPREPGMPDNPDVIISYEICNRSITEIRTDMLTKKYTITSLQTDLLPFSDEDMLKNCLRFIKEKSWEIKQKNKDKVR